MCDVTEVRGHPAHQDTHLERADWTLSLLFLFWSRLNIPTHECEQYWINFLFPGTSCHNRDSLIISANIAFCLPSCNKCRLLQRCYICPPGSDAISTHALIPIELIGYNFGLFFLSEQSKNGSSTHWQPGSRLSKIKHIKRSQWGSPHQSRCVDAASNGHYFSFRTVIREESTRHRFKNSQMWICWAAHGCKLCKKEKRIGVKENRCCMWTCSWLHVKVHGVSVSWRRRLQLKRPSAAGARISAGQLEKSLVVHGAPHWRSGTKCFSLQARENLSNKTRISAKTSRKEPPARWERLQPSPQSAAITWHPCKQEMLIELLLLDLKTLFFCHAHRQREVKCRTHAAVGSTSTGGVSNSGELYYTRYCGELKARSEVRIIWASLGKTLRSWWNLNLQQRLQEDGHLLPAAVSLLRPACSHPVTGGLG